MRTLLTLPSDALFSANFIDRPFLQHVVEFVAAQGARDILVMGESTDRARQILGDGRRWDATIVYQEAYAAPDIHLLPAAPGEKCLLASAISLPLFALKDVAQRSAGTILYSEDSREWTGWAVLEEEDAATMPTVCDRAVALSYLEGLPNYEKIFVDTEYRCGGAQDLWKAHETALDSRFSGVCHNGLEIRPGVWMGRNASIAASAAVTAPCYIGENSRIGPGAQIGPFAVIGKDCLIAPRTIVRHSVVAPGTYAGDNLELDHVLAGQHEVFDVRLGVSVNNVGHSIVDNVFDLHWLTVPRQILAAVWSATVRCYLNVSSGLSWRKRGSRAKSTEQPAENQALHLRIPPRNDGAAHRDRPGRGASLGKARSAHPE